MLNGTKQKHRKLVMFSNYCKHRKNGKTERANARKATAMEKLVAISNIIEPNSEMKA